MELEDKFNRATPDLAREVEQLRQQLAEIHRLKEDNKYKEELGLKVAGLRQTCSNLSREKADLQDELVQAKEEMERLREAHNEYRAAVREIVAKEGEDLNKIAQLQAELASLREALSSIFDEILMRNIIAAKQVNMDRIAMSVKITELEAVFVALSSHESEWPVEKEG